MTQKKGHVLITGASSGIGQALAVRLSKYYNLILHGRDEERLSATKLLCNQEHEHLILKLDFTKLDEIESRLTEFIIGNHLEVNHFIHSAGYMKILPLKSTSLDVINKIFATNVISAALLTKVLIQRKVNNDSLKSIVFISSNISNFGARGFSIYGSSKGALDAMMRSLAVELATNVRVNSVLPGAIRTEMTESIFGNSEVSERMAKDYPLGFGEPGDICDIVEFLISEKSKWITGQQFTVDGGRTVNISG